MGSRGRFKGLPSILTVTDQNIVQRSRGCGTWDQDPYARACDYDAACGVSAIALCQEFWTDKK